MDAPTAREKRDFMEQYVLNRTKANTGGLEGDAVAREAERAWDYIHKSTQSDSND